MLKKSVRVIQVANILPSDVIISRKNQSVRHSIYIWYSFTYKHGWLLYCVINSMYHANGRFSYKLSRLKLDTKSIRWKKGKHCLTFWKKQPSHVIHNVANNRWMLKISVYFKNTNMRITVSTNSIYNLQKSRYD